ncbi:MAG: VWA domain-containing protein [Gemmatimonadaceae bacterium]|nr:VWA domain-containing protein [Gemmatimonadaceae bacterium]
MSAQAVAHPTSSRSTIAALSAVAALLLLGAPQGVAAQGRLIGRPCINPTPPRCAPDADCVVPVTTLPCAPTLVRVSSDVKIALADRVLRYEVTEVFKNASGRVAEADYVFPLPAGAAFEDLKLLINGELVSGETMTADRARGIYEEIVRRQRDPALVEWMGSGMLRTRIFPIAPGEEKKVVVRYQSVAEREGDALRIDYRRGTDPNGTGAMVRPGQRVNPAQLPSDTRRGEEGEWSRVRFVYRPGSNYGEPYSPTHTLRTKDEGDLRSVDARGSASDMTILLPLRRANTAALSVLAHAPGGERGFALITVTPPAASRRTMPRDLTFVVDVSGSMSGRKLEQAKAAGRALLETLRPDDRFRIIDFSTDVRSFRDGWSAATGDNLAEARRYLSSLRAEGSTNISGALEEALGARATGDRLPLVVFVTDGEPTVGERNPDAIAAMASRRSGEARLFSVGVSADVNATLIEQLAVEGHGTAHFVRDSESVERAVGLLARRLSTPVLTNVKVRADGVRLSQLLPSGELDVFAGQDLVILARYEGDGNATLRLEGESVDGPVSWSTRANFPERTRDNPFVARLWASQRVGWLAAEKRKRGATSEMDEEIKSLGERYGIPTEFSSYLVVEPGMTVATAAGGATGGVRRDAASTPVTLSSDLARRRGSEGAADAAAATAQAAPAAPAMASNELRFEAARKSAAQREAKSLGEMDAMEPEGGATQRRVGSRRFTLVGGVWMDAAYSSRMRTVTVKPFSTAYFALVQRLGELAPAFALGDRVVVTGRKVAVRLAPDGADAVESLTTAALDAIVRDW